jgi:hypothetical protein
MNACRVAVLAACAGSALPALARDLEMTKDRDSSITVYHTLMGARYGDPAYSGTLPAGHTLKIPGGNHWWTDFSIIQDPLAAGNHRTTTAVAAVVGQPGNYTMLDLASAVEALAPLSGGRIPIPDLRSSFFDVFVAVDLDNYAQSGGGLQPWTIGMILQFQNGVCMQNPAIHAGLQDFQFTPASGWNSPQPFNGQLDVFGSIVLTPKRCYANCDGSTTSPALNVQDFACFLNYYAAGSQEANCDGSTTPPTLNVLDFSCFLNAYAQGCT